MSFLRRLHCNYRVAQGETYGYFAPLMLLRVKSVKLLELVVDIRRHLKTNCLERWPIGGLETLYGEVNVGVWPSGLLRLAIIGGKVGFELLGLFFHRVVVLEHALELVHLLHATRHL